MLTVVLAIIAPTVSFQHGIMSADLCDEWVQITDLSLDVSESAACRIFCKLAGKRMSYKESQGASDLLMPVCWQDMWRQHSVLNVTAFCFTGKYWKLVQSKL